MQEQLSFLSSVNEEIKRIQTKRGTVKTLDTKGYYDVYAWITGSSIKVPYVEHIGTEFAENSEQAKAKYMHWNNVPENKKKLTHGGMRVNIRISAELSPLQKCAASVPQIHDVRHSL